MKRNNIYNIIVAAGSGSRFGSDTPKQFLMLGSRPVLMHTIDRMRHAIPGGHIILVLNPCHLKLWENLCDEFGFDSPTVVFGGSSRWESVKNAIDTIKLSGNDDGIITVHDGARPLIDQQLIERILTGVNHASGSIPAIRVTDSLRIINNDGSSSPIDRSLIRAVQTPQAFDAARLIAAYRLPYRDSFTDDASVMAAAGYKDITLVDGSQANIKITTPVDLDIATFYMQHEKTALS